MDLQIKEVAQLLNVSESTILQWISNKQIPAYQIGKSYRFNRTEIENWVMNHPFPPQPNQTGGGIQLYNLFRALHKGDVLHAVPGTNKESVIRATMNRIAESINVDADIMTELLMDRENLMPTALNNGVGVPHTRDTLLTAPYDAIFVVFPEFPLNYGAFDKKPVDILFFLFACEDKRHLHLLAKIAHLVHQPESMTFLRTQPSKDKLLSYIKAWESALTGFPTK